MGNLDDKDVVEAIRLCGDADTAAIAAFHQDCSHSEVNDMRDQAREMTNSRMAAWKRGTRQPTWAEVRAMMYGLYLMYE